MLKPQHEYIIRIIGGIGTAISQKIADVMGAEVALGHISSAAVEVGKETAQILQKKVKIKERNTMSAVLLCKVGMKISELASGEILEYAPDSSKMLFRNCKFSELQIGREPYLCMICPSYISGVARWIDDSISVGMKKISAGCEFSFKMDSPDGKDPMNLRTSIFLRLGEHLVNRNELVADMMSLLLLRLGGRLARVIGSEPSEIFAREAEVAGRKHSQEFCRKLGVEDAPKLIKGVRETLQAEVEIDGKRIITRKCPLSRRCMDEVDGRFSCILCEYYTRGLISIFRKNVKAEEEGCYKVKSCSFVINEE